MAERIGDLDSSSSSSGVHALYPSDIHFHLLIELSLECDEESVQSIVEFASDLAHPMPLSITKPPFSLLMELLSL